MVATFPLFDKRCWLSWLGQNYQQQKPACSFHQQQQFQSTVDVSIKGCESGKMMEINRTCNQKWHSPGKILNHGGTGLRKNKNGDENAL